MSGLISAAVPRLKASLIAMGGSAGIGFVQQGDDAVPRTLQDKGRESVTVSDFRKPTDPDDTLSIRRAIASGKKHVRLGIDAVVSAPISFAANQIFDFDGGKLVVTAGIEAPNGVMSAVGLAGVVVLDPVIDASATGGVLGMMIADCTRPRIESPFFIKCSMALTATSGAKRGYRIKNPVVAMMGYASTAVYISTVNGCTITNPEISQGAEGIGLYNGVRDLKVRGGTLWGHQRDGFVIISGQIIDVSGTYSTENGQSGFTTQRMFSGEDCKRVSFRGLKASHNGYDGFDIRGYTLDTGENYVEQMELTMTNCAAWENTGTGFYIVNAPGVTGIGLVAKSNRLAGIYLNNSPYWLLANCQVISNASDAPSEGETAGIVIHESPHGDLIGTHSTNAQGASQKFGLRISGAKSKRIRVIGGEFHNNLIQPFSFDTVEVPDIHVQGASCDDNPYTRTLEISPGMIYRETAFGIPGSTFQLVRPKGSQVSRLNGVGGEEFFSDGGGIWRAK